MNDEAFWEHDCVYIILYYIHIFNKQWTVKMGQKTTTLQTVFSAILTFDYNTT